MQFTPTVSAALAMAMTAVASADVVFDNTQGPVGYYDDGQGSTLPVFEDLHIQGGGLLTTVTFGYYGWGMFPTQTDIAVTLAEDNGDGLPGEDDPLLLTFAYNWYQAELGYQFVTFDASGWEVELTDGSLIWASLQITATSCYPMLCDPVAIGSTDSFIYPSRIPEEAIGGVAFRLETVPSPGALALLGLSGLIGKRRRS